MSDVFCTTYSLSNYLGAKKNGNFPLAALALGGSIGGKVQAEVVDNGLKSMDGLLVQQPQKGAAFVQVAFDLVDFTRKIVHARLRDE